MTIICVFWCRVELQLLRYTPWLANQGRDTVEADEYSLDYTDMLLPTVLMQSFKRKHFLVTIASVTALLVKLQIVLSSSIFQMVGVGIEQPAQVRLLDSFVANHFNTSDPVQEGAGSPRFGPSLMATVAGIQNFDMPLPFGVSDTFAYQTFSPVSAGAPVSGRPLVESPLTVVVEGLFMDTECLKLENHTLRVEDNEFEIRLKFENCDTVITKRGAFRIPGQWDNEHGWDEPRMEENDRPCATLPQKHPQTLFLVSDLGLPVEREDQTSSCAAVLCSGYSWLSKVQVIDDGTNPRVTLLSEGDLGTRTDFGVDPWDIMAFRFGFAFPESSQGQGQDAWPLDVYHQILSKEAGISSYNSSFLYEVAKFMMTEIGPMIAHTHFKVPEESLLQGSVAQHEQRLQLNMPVCIAVTTLSSICLCSALFILISSLGTPASNHRDPMTFLGLTVFIKASLRNSLDGFPADLRRSKDSWSRCTFTPLVQRPSIRGLFLFFVLSLIIGLVTGLMWSRSHKGLATVAEDGYDALAWQSLPALAMLVVSLYSASLDASVRSLATISRLTTKPCRAAELDESPLDMVGIRALIYSWRRSIPAIMMLQLIAMACTFLPIMSSILFSPIHVPGEQHVVLQQESWFGGANWSDTSDARYDQSRSSLSNLNMVKRQSNITFPRNTYADLLFPNLTIEDSLWGLSRSAVITTPAAKLVSTCQKLDADEFELIDGETSREIRILDTGPSSDHDMSTDIPDDESPSLFFGLMARSPRAAMFQGPDCSNWTSNAICETEYPWVLYAYVWGRVRNGSTAGDDLYEHLAVWECNYTWADVTTKLNVISSDGDTLIDHSNPPVVLNASEPPRPWDPPFTIPHMVFSDMYDTVPGPTDADVFPPIDNVPIFSRRFGLILEPYGPMTVEDLGNPHKDEEILEALRYDLGFAAAQLANVEKRLRLDEEASTVPSRHGYLQPINATLIDNSRYRLAQDQRITIAIVSILCIILVIHTWALISETCPRRLQPFHRWGLKIRTKGLAPPQFSTITMMDVLLRGSNVGDVLPASAHLMPKRELHRHLDDRGRRFRMGWFYNAATGSHEYTLGVIDDDTFVFKGRRQGLEVSNGV